MSAAISPRPTARAKVARDIPPGSHEQCHEPIGKRAIGVRAVMKAPFSLMAGPTVSQERPC